MLERLLGTRCSSVCVWVRLSSLISSKGPKGRGKPEKITSSVDLMKKNRMLGLHSQELLFENCSQAASQSHYLQNTSLLLLTRALCVFSGIWTTCGLPCLRTQLEDTPQLWPVTELFRTLSVGCSSSNAENIQSPEIDVTKRTIKRTIKATRCHPKEASAAELNAALTDFLLRVYMTFFYILF